jgi:ferredoxin
MNTVRVNVDLSRCQGHNRCLDLAPDLFADDELGYASAIGDGEVCPDQEHEAQLAVLNCPEHAIEITR